MPEMMWRARPLNLKDVSFAGGFWGARLETNRRATLPIEYTQCKDTGRIDAWNWKPGMPNQPHIFWDSDVAKWIEAAAYSLTSHRDKELENQIDGAVDLMAAGQLPDGYLNSHYTRVEPDNRWTNLRDCHELYCAGHLMEAAVAYREATGKGEFLDVMCRYADHIAKVFGTGAGQKRGYPGHEEIELALVKLYRATGNRRYLELSKHFIDERGRQQPHYYDVEAEARGEQPGRFHFRTYEYCQAHKPVREQSEVVGHAVRAFYLYSGMADVAGETHDAELLAACRRLWQDATERKMYVTGGVGPSASNEGFTRPYDLPNDTAYAETCATIALVFFAHRMLQIELDGKYADVMERALYNGVLSGVSLDGRGFFYANMLQADPVALEGSHIHMQHVRQPWFGCACCPPNVARLVASIGRYVYSSAPDAIYVHLYAAGSATAEVAGAAKVTLTQQTDYPWDGEVKISVGLDRPATFALALRVPGWCRKHKLTVNGKAVSAAAVKGYVKLRRRWSDGDKVVLSLAMPVERVSAHPSVTADAGKVAIQRGPVVYCLEQCDNAADVLSVSLPDKAKLAARYDRKLLGGCAVIEGRGLGVCPAGWSGRLYRAADEVTTKQVKIKAIPYCMWANRKPGAMTVWLPRV
ncbi:MAG TPA: beta-L-arabinofuranosidase domain-containing protein [Phycisphaerae bacterium]|nr:beta-L-arabinofuranosidase domain-containing protein [Phycisphaerae bacterium]